MAPKTDTWIIDSTLLNTPIESLTPEQQEKRDEYINYCVKKFGGLSTNEIWGNEHCMTIVPLQEQHSVETSQAALQMDNTTIEWIIGFLILVIIIILIIFLYRKFLSKRQVKY